MSRLRVLRALLTAIPVVLLAGVSGCKTEAVRAGSAAEGSSGVYDSPSGDSVDDRSAVHRKDLFGGTYDPVGDPDQSSKGDTPEGVAFARYVVGTDPDHKLIKDAFVRDNQVLGVIVNPTMARGQVDQLLSSLLRDLQQRFTKYPLQVVAYYENGGEMARAVYDGQNTNTQWAH